MTTYPFPYDIKVYIAGDDTYEVAYYTHQKQAYKRIRKVDSQTWEDTTPIEIDRDTFWMAVACIDFVRER